MTNNELIEYIQGWRNCDPQDRPLAFGAACGEAERRGLLDPKTGTLAQVEPEIDCEACGPDPITDRPCVACGATERG